MPRPATVTILEAVNNHAGHLEIWADVGGGTMHFCLHRNGLERRKVYYGLAHVERVQEVDEGGQPITGAVTETIVDDVPDADERALQAFFAEQLDRLEQNGVELAEMHGFAPDPREVKEWLGLAAPRGRRAAPRTERVRDRPDLRGERRVARKAPERREPRVVGRTKQRKESPDGP
jgi:hypothetical protein